MTRSEFVVFMEQELIPIIRENRSSKIAIETSKGNTSRIRGSILSYLRGKRMLVENLDNYLIIIERDSV